MMVTPTSVKIFGAGRAGLIQAWRGLEANECDKKSGDVVSCAKYIYENVKLIGKPGMKRPPTRRKFVGSW